MLRRLLPLLLFLAALALCGLPPSAQSDEGRREEDSLSTKASRQAARKALNWLKEHQHKDGYWECDVGFKLNEDYRVEKKRHPHVGVSALAGTAFLASGNVPGRGPYAKNVERALAFVLSCQRESGYISAHGTRMYSHAFATMFLAEIYGMTRDRRVRSALQRAVEYTYKAQNDEGGWRYVPNDADSDMSITVCQVVALRAAKNKGIRVPRESIEKAVDYVLNSAVTRDRDRVFRRGSFLYQWRSSNAGAQRNTRTSFALTAAGLTTLYGAGLYTDRDLQDFVRERKLAKYTVKHDPPPSFEHMLKFLDDEYSSVATGVYQDHYFYYYGNYYAVQAMFIAGGRHWKTFYPRLQNDLVRRQNPDGSWRCKVRAETERGTEYPLSTAIGAMILQVPYNYLPIFQR